LIRGIQKHFSRQRKYTPTFVKTHFHYGGCWQTNKRAFGFDLGRAPINLLWAPIYIAFIAVLLLLRLAGIKQATTWAKNLPGGLTTRVQSYVNQKVELDLVCKDGLKRAMLSEVESLSISKPNSIEKQNEQEKQLEDIVEQSLKQLMLTRTASADISNTLFSTAIGALAFKKFTPGGFGLGIILASLWVKFKAEKSFFLGDTMGSWYYAVFPPKPDPIEITLSVLCVMLLLAIVASFSGLATDPIQARIGIHKKRLNTLLKQLEKDLVDKASNRFKPLDPYIARILELFDTFKSQISL